MNSSDIRQKFFTFFTARGHEKVPSSSLIPAQDPTLLFANAGMNQFKDVFLGKEKRSYTRAVSIQKCVRAGGKHNDLDAVGFTKRHLTFFEMMGNFSFGDYFKKEAIEYAWEFLTKDIGLPKDKLYASVYHKDEEAYQLWLKMIGLPPERIIRLGEQDNFWQMGDTGPCGPCTEIYIDRGSALGCGQKTCAPGCACDRFLEIWNLVFMQYDRQPDGTDKPLKQTGVDTGMGFERLAAVVQNKDSVFQTDVFAPIITSIEKLTGLAYTQQPPHLQAAFHVLADHIRSSSLIIADGATPSNEGRGYVVRKIIRRAALFSQKLNKKSNIFPELVQALVEVLGPHYPELGTQQQKITAILRDEVEKFSHNLERGQHFVKDYIAQSTQKVITGQQAFKLYDTYGFPFELTSVIAQEHGFTVDREGFEMAMKQQREQSGKKQDTLHTFELPPAVTTTFTGYEELTTQSKILALIKDTVSVSDVPAGNDVWVIGDRSPFYVEGGGQVSDTGWIEVDGVRAPLKQLKRFNDAIGALVTAPARLAVGMTVRHGVDEQLRLSTMKNHTATHLLQAALIQVLGKHVQQSGSLVDPHYLRFDFTSHESPTPDQIKQVEDIVNQKVMENISVNITWSSYQDALSRGVIAFFGEKYNPERVRTVGVPGFSAELCGGTHVRATGDIGFFKITDLSSLGAGNRRIVALTGPKALALFQHSFAVVKSLSTEFSVPVPNVLNAVTQQKKFIKDLQTKLKTLNHVLVARSIPQWLNALETVGTIPFLFLELPDHSTEELKDIGTELVKSKPGLYFLVSATDTSCSYVVAASPNLASFQLKNFQAWLAQSFGLKGGGSPTMVQGGGSRFERDWVNKIKDWIKNQ